MKAFDFRNFCHWQHRLALLFLLACVVVVMPVAAASPGLESFETAEQSADMTTDEDLDFALRLDSRWPKTMVKSFVRVGNRGEEKLDVDATELAEICDEPIWVFDHAEIEITRNRFGGVQFVQLPQAGCVADCLPIVVRWYHEPTGHLVFGVRVFQRQTTLECTGDGLNEEVDS